MANHNLHFFAKSFVLLLFLSCLQANAQFSPIAILEDFEDDRQFVSVGISNDGAYILGSTFERNTIWNANTGQIVSWLDETVPINNDISFDNRYVASGVYGYKAIVWELASGKEIFTFQDNETPPPESMRIVQFTSDGAYLLTEGLRFSAWDLKTGELYKNLGSVIKANGPSDFYTLRDPSLVLVDESLVIRDENSQIVGTETNINIYNIHTEELVRTVAKNVERLTMSSNKRFLSYTDMTVGPQYEDFVIVDLNTFEEVCRKPGSDMIGADLDISNDGSFFITSGRGEAMGSDGANIAQLTRISNKELMRSYEFQETDTNLPNKVRLFPDGKKFLTLLDNEIHIYDISDLNTGIGKPKLFEN